MTLLRYLLQEAEESEVGVELKEGQIDKGSDLGEVLKKLVNFFFLFGGSG